MKLASIALATFVSVAAVPAYAGCDVPSEIDGEQLAASTRHYLALGCRPQHRHTMALGRRVAVSPTQPPAPRIESPKAAPAPAPYTAPPNTYQADNGDAVPFTYDNGAMFVAAAIGGRPVTMQVDTGANVCTIPEALANELIASGEATELQQSSSELADGQFHRFRHISVSMLVVGNHWGKDIQMTVMPSGTPLLSLPVLLSSGNGKFTVDAVKRKIIFG